VEVKVMVVIVMMVCTSPEVLNSMMSAQWASFFKGWEFMWSNDSDTMNNNEHTISGTGTTSEWEEDEATAKMEITGDRSVSAQFGQKVPKK
jgi:hypothetical protein